jgi:hypothetical protein
VDDDVRAGLGHRELDVGEDLVVDVQRVAEPSEGVPDDGDVLGPSRQREDEIGRGHGVRLPVRLLCHALLSHRGTRIRVGPAFRSPGTMH